MEFRIDCSASRFFSEVFGSLILAITTLSWSVRFCRSCLRLSSKSALVRFFCRAWPVSSTTLPAPPLPAASACLAAADALAASADAPALPEDGGAAEGTEPPYGVVSVSGISFGPRCPTLERQGRSPMVGSFSTGHLSASSAGSIRWKVTTASCLLWLICMAETIPKRPKYSISTSMLFTLGGTRSATRLTPPLSLKSNRGPPLAPPRRPCAGGA
mmetsp:Transcript_76893/g.198027  ORF Transcript_76893/g.198027 Transcript_76893/m.198027 type:complete len:215 (-) Transcript_76893:22-666(-)